MMAIFSKFRHENREYFDRNKQFNNTRFSSYTNNNRLIQKYRNSNIRQINANTGDNNHKSKADKIFLEDNLCKISINNLQFQACIDSGSNINILQFELYEKWKEIFQKDVLESFCTKLHFDFDCKPTSVSDEELQVFGMVRLKYTFGKSTCMDNFYLIKNISPSIIIGLDSLQANNCIIRCNEQLVQIKSTSAPVYLKKSLILDPHKACVVRAYIMPIRYADFLPDQILNVTQRRKYGIFIQPSISKLESDNTVLVQVSNPTNTKFQMGADRFLTHVSACKKNPIPVLRQPQEQQSLVHEACSVKRMNVEHINKTCCRPTNHNNRNQHDSWQDQNKNVTEVTSHEISFSNKNKYLGKQFVNQDDSQKQNQVDTSLENGVLACSTNKTGHAMSDISDTHKQNILKKNVTNNDGKMHDHSKMFKIPSHLPQIGFDQSLYDEVTFSKLVNILNKYKNIFVDPDNPSSVGKYRNFRHDIQLKPDAIPKISHVTKVHPKSCLGWNRSA
jgi:hypothetical protein